MVYLNIDIKFDNLTEQVSVSQVIIRFLCVILLHMQIEAEVRQSLSMLKYQNDHPDSFVDSYGESTIFPATSIIVMQLATSIATEVINLLLIIQATDAMSALMNFVALGIICQIDDIIFSALKQEPLKEAVSPEGAPIIVNTTGSLRKSGRSKKQTVVRKFYKFVKFLYATYFYFLPMFVPLMSYLSPEIKQFGDLIK